MRFQFFAPSFGTFLRTEPVVTNEEIIAFVEKNGNKNMFLGKMRGKIRRKGLESLTKNELEAIKKRMKEGALIIREVF